MGDRAGGWCWNFLKIECTIKVTTNKKSYGITLFGTKKYLSVFANDLDVVRQRDKFDGDTDAVYKCAFS